MDRESLTSCLNSQVDGRPSEEHIIMLSLPYVYVLYQGLYILGFQIIVYFLLHLLHIFFPTLCVASHSEVGERRRYCTEGLGGRVKYGCDLPCMKGHVGCRDGFI